MKEERQCYRNKKLRLKEERHCCYTNRNGRTWSRPSSSCTRTTGRTARAGTGRSSAARALARRRPPGRQCGSKEMVCTALTCLTCDLFEFSSLDEGTVAWLRRQPPGRWTAMPKAVAWLQRRWKRAMKRQVAWLQRRWKRAMKRQVDKPRGRWNTRGEGSVLPRQDTALAVLFAANLRSDHQRLTLV